MSDTSYGTTLSWQPPTQSAGATDIVTQLQAIVRQLTALVQAINGRVTFGTLTLAAAASTTIQQTAVKSNSVIQLTPTNASAATLTGSAKSLYVSAISSGTSFTVTTASNASAAGTEVFLYTINTPT
jgi:hypothetical protein